MEHPRLIQGGMGVAVSNWRLARAVSSEGELGVVSGTALNLVLTRRLQTGDEGGHVRRALGRFPSPGLVQRILSDYFIEGGKAADAPFKSVPLFAHENSAYLEGLNVAGSFVEVTLAKEGHEGKVGVNFLAKITLPNPSGIYGAMLAGVDYVFVGAGIPLAYPKMIDRLARHEDVALEMTSEGGDSESTRFLRFSPGALDLDQRVDLATPFFVPIVSSEVLARSLIKRAEGPIDGFVVEGPSAGGHNAPPRGAMKLDAGGEPIYGPRDECRTERFLALERPFWLAGSRHGPEDLERAIAAGATGIQVGTPFAYCQESGFTDDLKARVREGLRSRDLRVFKDSQVSPTGYPFNVVKNVGLDESYDMEMNRRCDLGFLRQQYQRQDGTVGFRCPAEREAYVRSGGAVEDTVNKRCLCNTLAASVGLGQVRRRGAEVPLLTAGNDIEILRQLFARNPRYGARDVLDHFRGVHSPVAVHA